MTRAWLLACGLLGSCAAGPQRTPRQEHAPAPPPADVSTHGRTLGFGFGARSLEDEGFARIDDPAVFALDYCEVLGLGSLRLEGGAHWAEDDARFTAMGQERRVEGEAWELSIGLNYSHLLLGRLRPYVGFGASVQFLEIDGFDQATGSAFEDDEVAPGGYVKAGLALQVTRTSHAAIEFRHLEGGRVQIDGDRLDTDYDQVLLVLGTSFAPGAW